MEPLLKAIFGTLVQHTEFKNIYFPAIEMTVFDLHILTRMFHDKLGSTHILMNFKIRCYLDVMHSNILGMIKKAP